jgi:hypothetical protein
MTVALRNQLTYSHMDKLTLVMVQISHSGDDLGIDPRPFVFTFNFIITCYPKALTPDSPLSYRGGNLA